MIFHQELKDSRASQFATIFQVVMHPHYKNSVFTYLFTSKLLFKTPGWQHAPKMAPTPACVRLKKEIINIALEVGCELMTALGTHISIHVALFSAATLSRG